MNRWIIVSVVGSVLALGIAPAAAQHGNGTDEHENQEQEPIQPICPVMDEPVNLRVSIATDDGPVFFCCKGCIRKYKADPAKYGPKLAAQRKVLAKRDKVQVTCPVSGEAVDRKVYVERDGKKVYFCSGDCVKKYQGSPSKYKKTLANSYTFQTKCPVMGEGINPQVAAATADGHKIYFCCKGCDKKFVAEPAKYVAKLAEQGFTVTPADMKVNVSP